MPDGDPAPRDGRLIPEAAIGASDRTFHAYIHVPFCAVRCGYCDFNTYTSSELKGFHQSDFVNRLVQEIGLSTKVLEGASIQNRELATVFFGGGTPTQLPASDLVSALGRLVETFGIKTDAEVTTEANPDTVDSRYLTELANGGFSRVSFGMQSAVPSVLKTLERTHDPENVPAAVQAAKDAGLATSVDLIYGAPGETLDDWKRTVEAALALETDHISAYALIVEPGTKLARQIESRQLAQPNEDLEADKYEWLDAALGNAGFAWYELSNFARSSNQQSRHNIAYWTGQDWWGYGPGAHSHIGGVRWWNAKHPTTYAKALEVGESPAIGRETLDETTRLTERVLLEVRLSTGLEVSVAKLANADAPKVVAALIAEQLIEPRAAFDGFIKLTLKGRLLADAVVKRLLA
jgi:oxygen-independent coproporphyrinogen-3 oxidase